MVQFHHLLVLEQLPHHTPQVLLAVVSVRAGGCGVIVVVVLAGDVVEVGPEMIDDGADGGI